MQVRPIFEICPAGVLPAPLKVQSPFREGHSFSLCGQENGCSPLDHVRVSGDADTARLLLGSYLA